MFAAAAALHKKQFDKYVESVGAEVELRLPATAVAAPGAADKVLGKRPAPTIDATTAYGDSLFVQAIWTSGTAITTEQGVPNRIAALGASDQVDVLVRCKLADVLLDAVKPLGRTQFHVCKDVRYQGAIFTVTGVDTSGLPPLGPYVCWVGLKKAGVE